MVGWRVVGCFFHLFLFSISFSLCTNCDVVVLVGKSIAHACSPSSLSTNHFWKMLVAFRKGRNSVSTLLLVSTYIGLVDRF